MIVESAKNWPLVRNRVAAARYSRVSPNWRPSAVVVLDAPPTYAPAGRCGVPPSMLREAAGWPVYALRFVFRMLIRSAGVKLMRVPDDEWLKLSTQPSVVSPGTKLMSYTPAA